MNRTRLLVLGAAASLAVSLGACSSSSTTTSAAGSTTTASPTVTAPSTATDLVAKAKAAAKAAKSVHISGSGTSDGKPVTIDAFGLLDGTAQSVSMSQDTAAFQVVTVGGVTYLKGNTAFWTSANLGTDPASVADKWVKFGPKTSQGFASMSVPSLIDSMFTEMATDLAPEVTKGEAKGIAVFSVASAKGAANGVFSVAADGSWLPVRQTSTVPNTADLTFAQWGSADPVTAPSGTVIDLTSLG